MKNSFVLLLVSLLLSAHAFSGGRLIWTWHEPGIDLFSPSFSATGKEVAIVRQRHVPDGGELEGLSLEESEKRMAPIDEAIKKDERYADPEVIFLAIGNSMVNRVDWGSAPVFSPDGQEIAYSYQKRPISRFRVLAKTQAGNEIRCYRHDTKNHRDDRLSNHRISRQPNIQPRRQTSHLLAGRCDQWRLRRRHRHRSGFR